MQTTELPSLAEHVQSLPARGAGRDRQLNRIIDLYASTAAAAALKAAAGRARDGIVATVLQSAIAILDDADPAANDRLSGAVSSPEFLSLMPAWVAELREIASTRPESGACTLASALELWTWTVKYFTTAAEGPRAIRARRKGAGADADAPLTSAAAAQAIDELAEVLCPLVAGRALVIEVSAKGKASAEIEFRRDLSHVYAAHVSASVGSACAELVFGHRRHLVWDAVGCASCYAGAELDDLEAMLPGVASGIRMSGDVIEADGSHAAKRGPCVSFAGMDTFMRLRNKLDGCLTGARIAKERAAAAIAASATPSKKSKGRA